MKKQHKYIFDLITLTVGSLFVAIAVVLFYKASHIPTGGTPGLSLLIHSVTNISPGLLILITNIPLLIWGYFLYGKPFVVKTTTAVVLTSLWVDVVFYFWPIGKLLTQNLMLMAVFGGAVVGVGIGLMFKSGGSPSGWGVLVKMLAKQTGIPVGKALVILDVAVILVSAIVYKNIESAMYGMISIFIAGKTIDVILAGKANAKAIHISCNNAEQLLPFIKHKLLSPGSIIHCDKADGTGARDIILVSVQREYIPRLVDVLKEHDPQAYMLVFDAAELYLAQSFKAE